METWATILFGMGHSIYSLWYGTFKALPPTTTGWFAVNQPQGQGTPTPLGWHVSLPLFKLPFKFTFYYFTNVDLLVCFTQGMGNQQMKISQDENCS